MGATGISVPPNNECGHRVIFSDKQKVTKEKKDFHLGFSSFIVVLATWVPMLKTCRNDNLEFSVGTEVPMRLVIILHCVLCKAKKLHIKLWKRERLCMGLMHSLSILARFLIL